MKTGATKATHATRKNAPAAAKPCNGRDSRCVVILGIVGTGLLAVPVLAGSAAYAVAETFGLRGSLELPASRALGFYAIVGAATLGGAGLVTTNIDPIRMLFWAAVINGIVSVPIIAAMMLAGSSHRTGVMALPRWLRLLGWAAAVLMALTVGLLAWSSLR
jgi:Mn2+/Fe2+ NRAMP family transporter